MHGERRVARTVGVLCATGALTMGLLATGSAVAAAPATTPVSTTADDGSASAVAAVSLPGKGLRFYSQAETQRFEKSGGDPAVLAYWTPARMKAATPLDQPGDAQRVAQNVLALAKAKPATASRPIASRFAAVRVVNAAPVTNFSITNGKLFFNGYESGSWCSASALNTASKRVLITAGHCVHSGKGGAWKSNVVFVPGYNAYNADRDPVGRFQAYRLRTFNSWLSNSDLNRDVGFVTTYSGGDRGARVVDTVGGHGLVYNGGTSFDVSIFGYPSNRSGGNAMSACWGTTQDNSASDNKSKIACNFGPGSSGGPWLWQYSNASGQGYARSVMSTVNSAGVNKGPYFDTAVRDAMNAANGDW